MADPTATTELSRLREARAKAGAEVSDLEAKQRAAHLAAQGVGAELAEAERVGASASKLHQLEERLADAKAVAAQPWAERIAGRRQRVRNCDGELRRHAQEHLPELAADIEGDGLVAVQEMVVAAEAFIQAYGGREEIARQLGALLP
jgi:hypothetical protein